jgi:nicotinamide-nucleotide adenylyltransferase
MKALFVGRFQPFHKGHLLIIKNASNKYSKIIIGIGSSQYHHTKNNPFSSIERKKMIESAMKEIKLHNYSIEEIPDIHNYPKWVPYVTEIIPDFDVVISNNTLIQNLFSEKEYTVVDTPIFDRKKYSGKEIRKRMIDDKDWENLVPDSVIKIIKDIKGVQRLKNLAKQE